MQGHYQQISMDERRRIYTLLGQKKRPQEIAALLGRHRSTIYREINRNTYSHEEEFARGYFPVTANDLAQERRRRLRKLWRSPELKEAVVKKLQDYWSPEQIAGYMKRQNHKNYACHETIYQFIYSSDGKENGLYRYLFRGRVKRRVRFGRKLRDGRIPKQNSIWQRPPTINSRETFGHWEGDLVIFQRQHGLSNITSLIERKSRYMLLAKNDNRSSGSVISKICERIQHFPSVGRQSITFDQGSEFMAYPLLRQNIKMDSYFCDPRSPWQKGAVENNNGRIRRFLPLETNLTEVSEVDLREICHRMNNTPRKCLGYQTPHEVFMSYLQAQQDWVGSGHKMSHFS